MTELADDSGRIGLGGKLPHEAICFALGATRSDRRMMRGWVDELIADGCLVHSDGALQFPNWEMYQSENSTPKRVAAARRKRRQADATEPRTDRDGATNGREPTATEPRTAAMEPRADHLLEPKCAEGGENACQRERLERETRERESRARAHARAPLLGLKIFEDVVREATGIGPPIATLKSWWRDSVLPEWSKQGRAVAELDDEVRAFGAWLAAYPKRDTVVAHLRFRDSLGKWPTMKSKRSGGVARARSHEEFVGDDVDAIFGEEANDGCA
jgi:hypothetical protein